MTSGTNDSIQQELATGIRKVIDAHGYSFQYAVIRRADELCASRASRWVFESSEFPIEVSGFGTHIDFVLRTPSRRVFLVAECKRADPARARWCFVTAPYTWRSRTPNELVFDEVQFTPPDSLRAHCCTHYTSQDWCHLGFELKTGRKGDGIGGRSPISEATKQVLRGVNGLVNHFFPINGRSFTEEGVVRFLPVIFTTAELYVADGDLSVADVQTGKLPSDWGKVREVDWLWFTHNQSPSLQHQWHPSQGGFEVSKTVRTEHARTIAVVGPSGIERFLGVDMEELLEP